jgi:hypothetical protein
VLAPALDRFVDMCNHLNSLFLPTFHAIPFSLEHVELKHF